MIWPLAPPCTHHHWSLFVTVAQVKTCSPLLGHFMYVFAVSLSLSLRKIRGHFPPSEATTVRPCSMAKCLFLKMWATSSAAPMAPARYKPVSEAMPSEKGVSSEKMMTILVGCLFILLRRILACSCLLVWLTLAKACLGDLLKDCRPRSLRTRGYMVVRLTSNSRARSQIVTFPL